MPHATNNGQDSPADQSTLEQEQPTPAPEQEQPKVVSQEEMRRRIQEANRRRQEVEQAKTAKELDVVYAISEEDFIDSIKRERPEETSFSDVYSQEEIDGDIEEVKKYERDFEEAGDRSKIQEYITMQEIIEGDWFRTDSNDTKTLAFMTSKYDDYFEGVDVAAVTGNPPIMFGIDFTYNKEKIAKKTRFMSRYNSDNTPFSHEKGITAIKYFEDNKSDTPIAKKGTHFTIPRFVVSFSPKITDRLFECRRRASWKNSNEYNKASKRLRLICLTELTNQVNQLYDHHILSDDPASYALSKELEQLRDIFEAALEKARAEDPYGAAQKFLEQDDLAKRVLETKIFPEDE